MVQHTMQRQGRGNSFDGGVRGDLQVFCAFGRRPDARRISFDGGANGDLQVMRELGQQSSTWFQLRVRLKVDTE